MAPNPLQKTFTSSPPEISSSKHLIAGLLTTVHGLEELSSDRRYVSCLWLLHPRLGNQDMMAPLAKSIISAWNKKLAKSGSKDSPGLITVSLDQRNHGSRMVDPIANGDWRSGDEQHAQDMFSAFRELPRNCSRSGPLLTTNHRRHPTRYVGSDNISLRLCVSA